VRWGEKRSWWWCWWQGVDHERLPFWEEGVGRAELGVLTTTTERLALADLHEEGKSVVISSRRRRHHRPPPCLRQTCPSLP
jgi:hypothetical protein